MKINAKRKQPVKIKDTNLEEVEEFTYLGSIVNIEGGIDADVKNRISKARVIFNILGKAWSAKNISRGTKMKIFNSNVKSMFLYGVETWRTTKTMLSCYSIFSFMCMFCRSLFVLLYFFFWPLCCLFFFDIRILIAVQYYNFNIIILQYGTDNHNKGHFTCTERKTTTKDHPHVRNGQLQQRTSFVVTSINYTVTFNNINIMQVVTCVSYDLFDIYKLIINILHIFYVIFKKQLRNIRMNN